MTEEMKVFIDQCNGEKPPKLEEEAVPLNGKGVADEEDTTVVNFEQAISMTGQGKFHNILQLGCGMCLISMISEILNTAYLLPSAECDFSLTSSDKGMLSAVCYLGMIASSHLWGFVADTKGRRVTLYWTLLLDGICALASSFSHSFWLFLVLRFFNGFFICGPAAVVYAYMGEFHSAATRSRAIMWGAVFISGAIMALPGVAWIIISQTWSLELSLYTYHSWRVFVIICGLPSFLTAALLILYLPESPKFLMAQDREEEALQVLRYMFTQNTGLDAQNYKVISIAREIKLDSTNNMNQKQSSLKGMLQLMWRQTKPVFVSPHLSNTLLGCSLMFGIYASFNGLLLWLPEMFNRLEEYAELNPGSSVTICEAMSAVGGNKVFNFDNATVSSNTEKIISSPDSILTDPLINETSTLDMLHAIATSHHVNNTEGCNPEVAPAVFIKSLVIGGSSAVANLICVLLIGHVGKKNLLVTCFLISAISGVAMLLARSATALLVLACILEGLTMTAPTVLNNILIEIFPTHLRAMAVCVSMLMGRVGTVVSSIVLGLILEINCTLVFIALGGILLTCGFLGYMLPAPWQWKVK